MQANYHTHTFRCYHATGTEEQYVRAALEAGLKVLGFSDHAPMPFAGGYESDFRMRVSYLPDYVETLLALREKYRGQIEILIGFEAEYYPAVFSDFLALLRPYPIDYLILGQHYLGNEYDSFAPGTATESEEVLRAYVDQVTEGMRSGAFTYVAHPDVVHFIGEDAVYRREIERLCCAAKDLSMPLEVNLLGLREGRHYPTPLFWEIAAACGNDVILGCDAHNSWRVALASELRDAEAFCTHHRLRVSERLPALRPLP